MAAFLLLQLTGVASQRQIIGVASPGNTIHVERDVDLSYDRTTIKVSSVVPVTVQRNNYGSSYLDVVRIRLICNSLFMDLLSSITKRNFITRLPRSLFPVPANFAKVLVTSDCDTSETRFVPNVVSQTMAPSPSNWMCHKTNPTHFSDRVLTRHSGLGSVTIAAISQPTYQTPLEPKLLLSLVERSKRRSMERPSSER